MLYSLFRNMYLTLMHIHNSLVYQVKQPRVLHFYGSSCHYEPFLLMNNKSPMESIAIYHTSHSLSYWGKLGQ